VAYLLDSDCVIDIIDSTPQAEDIAGLAGEPLYMSIVSYIEVFQGTLRTGSSRSAEDVRDFVERVPILPLSQDVAERAARIREDLQRLGRRTDRRSYDVIIAAIAIEHGLTLVTRNVDDFADIPDLLLHRP
jgi:tRNA(fMet)-specific endonuclease VapC